jgi:hypothetical protein
MKAHTCEGPDEFEPRCTSVVQFPVDHPAQRSGIAGPPLRTECATVLPHRNASATTIGTACVAALSLSG